MCIQCRESVLSENQVCEDFCHDGEKNQNGVCIECPSRNCIESKQPQILLKKVGDFKFRVSLDQPLFQQPLNTLKEKFEISIESLKKEKDYQIEVTPND